jgi:hypothetical protein
MALRKVLLLTHSEFGEANSVLAVSHALVTGNQDVEVHVASFAPLRAEVERVNASAILGSPEARRIIFHELPGQSLTEALVSGMNLDPTSAVPEPLRRPPNFWNTPRALVVIARVLVPWEGPEMVEIHRKLLRVISEVAPDITAVNSMFGPGLTACRTTDIKHVMLCPLSAKDVGSASQPYARMLWKYPV